MKCVDFAPCRFEFAKNYRSWTVAPKWNANNKKSARGDAESDRKEEAPPDGGALGGASRFQWGGTYVMGEGSAPSQL